MKEGWEYRKLGEICDFRSGFAFKSNKFTKIGEPIIRISDIQNEKIDDSNLVYFDPKSYTEDLSKYLIYPDDILIAMSGGTTGKIGTNTSNRTYYLNQRVGVFRENKKYLNHRYLFYFLHTKSEESLKIAAGAAQPNLSTAQIKSFIIPVSHLSEQQRIVDYLDSAFAKIDAMKANAEKALNDAKALFQASLKKMLEPKEGWEEKTIGDILNLRRGHDLTHSQMNGCGYPVAGSNGRIGYHNSCTPISPCITVGRSGSVGAVNIYKECWAHNTTLYIDDFKGNYPKYLYYLLKSIDLAHLNSGSAVPTLNRNFIHPIIVPYVKDIVAQQSIVATLDNIKSKVDKLQENYDKISLECDALKQAILRQVFE